MRVLVERLLRKLRNKPKLPACMQNALNLTWVIPNYSKLREDAAKKSAIQLRLKQMTMDTRGAKLYPNGTKSDGNLSLFPVSGFIWMGANSVLRADTHKPQGRH